MTGPKTEPERGRTPAWLLAVPLVAAAAAVLWLLVGSSLFGPSAGAGDEVGSGGGSEAEGAEGDPARLAASGRPVVEKAPEKPAEEESKPTFTKAEGIFGRVTDSREKPIPGAKVSLHLTDPESPWSDRDGPLVGSVEAGADGAYLVGPAPAGRMRVRGDAPGYASTVLAVSSRGARVDLILDRSGALKVIAKDRKGAPVKDAEVRVNSGGVQALPRKTGETGEVVVDGLASGPSQVTVSAPGYAPVNVGEVPLEPGKTTERSVVMSKGVPVAGKVTDETGRAVEGAEVDARLQWDVTATKSEPVKTDAEGRFQIPSAGGPGEWVQISAKKEGVGEGANTVQLQAGAAAIASAPAAGAGPGGGQEVEVKLASPLSAKGRVLDADGKAVPDGKVIWLQVWGTAAAKFEAKTDADGQFSLALPAGTPKEGWSLMLGATAPGKGVGVSQATSELNKTVGTTVRLSGAGSITGKVTGPGGEGLEGAAVVVYLDWGKPLQGLPPGVQPWMFQQMFWDPRAMNLASTTDATGAFRVDDVPTGSYRLHTTWGLDRGSSSETASVRAGSVETVKLEIGSGNTIEGRVLDHEGKAVFGAYVQGQDPINNKPGENRSAFARSEADGRFILRGVLGERWTLTVQHAGFAPKSVEGVANGDKSVEVRLVPLGWVSGVVTADGSPFQGAFTVSLEATQARSGNEGGGVRWRSGNMGWGGGGREETFTSADGTFTMRGVGAGSYKVNVTTQDNWIPAGTPEVAVNDGRGTEGVEVRLSRGAVFLGSVLEEGSRTPLASASVNLRIRGQAQTGGTTWAWAQTDAKGQFAMQGLASGTYTVQVHAPSGVNWEDEVRLEAGSTATKELLSQRWGVLRVKVLDPQGNAIAGATVNLQSERGSMVQPNWEALRKEGLVDMTKPNPWQAVWQTDAEGNNTRYHVAPGRIQVNVHARGQKTAAPVTWCVVASDQTTEVTVQFPAPPGEGDQGG